MDIPWNERATLVTRFAREEAERTNSASVGGRHLLVGIIKEGTGVASAMLCKAGANLDEVRRVLGKPFILATRGSVIIMAKSLKDAKEFGIKMATERGDLEVCPVHFLLGLIHTADADTIRVLCHFNLSPVEFGEKVLAAYDEKKQAKETNAALRKRIEYLESFLKVRNMTA